MQTLSGEIVGECKNEKQQTSFIFRRKSNSICVNTFPLQKFPGWLENPLLSRQKERMISVGVMFRYSD